MFSKSVAPAALWIAMGVIAVACSGGGDPAVGEDTGALQSVDADGDGYFSGADCDDDNADVNPDARERCDGVDNNCDGVVDEAGAEDASIWYADLDGDGFGDRFSPRAACAAPVGFVSLSTDCNDDDPDVNPGAVERCDDDDIDEDCTGTADDADPGTDPGSMATWFTDGDGDGFGDPDRVVLACSQPDGAVADDSDCDDRRADVNPDAAEVCDERDEDEDCSGGADDDDAGLDLSTRLRFYADTDGDGYGDGATPVLACDLPLAASTDALDCDDGDSAVHPGAAELRQDGIDQDCDGVDAPYRLVDLVAGDLVITEIMQNPTAAADPWGEWFELQNRSGGQVNLAGLYAYDLTNAGAISSSFTVSGTLLVEPDAYIVLGYSIDTATNGGAPVNYGYGSGFPLANGADELILTESSARRVEFDRVFWDDGATFPDPTGASMELCPGREDQNELGTNWVVGTATYGQGDRGSPGRANDGRTCP